MAKPDDLIEMGVVGAAHGLKGEVRVKSFAADPSSLGNYGPLLTGDGRSLEISGQRPAGAMLVVRFKGVNDRAAAEALNGVRLFVERARLPVPADEDEFYHADLIGLAVRGPDGSRIGRIAAVENFGGGDLLEIALEGKGGVLVPFSRAAVPEISIADGFVVVEPVAAGLAQTDEAAEDGEPP